MKISHYETVVVVELAEADKVVNHFLSRGYVVERNVGDYAYEIVAYVRVAV